MQHTTRIVISASRRTDIPAFYMDWFMERIKQGAFETVNPYNRQEKAVPARPENVHTIVFWSKDFGPFIRGGFGKTLSEMGYNLFFNFTVNSSSPLLEPRVPPLKNRLDQMEDLCVQFGAGCVNWRFDPVCFFTFNEAVHIQDNLYDFSRIAEKASQSGIRRCTTSFMDHYPKIRKRIETVPGFSFIDPPLEQKRDLLLSMEKELAEKNIRLYTCCEKPVMEALPAASGILKSSCIPSDLLVEMYGGHLSLKKDSGQRITDGCGCRVSVDIGSYHRHPCLHDCLFCYANPSSDKIARNLTLA
ncbi:MAG: DUF1848 domain-containing protein [Pseudomonadota bacterium]